jgi:F0F1-type ATP synthase membrane subunit b/b'
MEINITVIFQAVLFGILLFSLSKFLFKPLIILFNERNLRTIQTINTANEILVENKLIKNKIKASIKLAKNNGSLNLAKIRDEAIFYKKELIRNAKNKAKKIIDKKRDLLIEEGENSIKLLSNEISIISKNIVFQLRK